MSAPAAFRQADVVHAIKGAQKTGTRVGRIAIDHAGKIIILRDRGESKQAAKRAGPRVMARARFLPKYVTSFTDRHKKERPRFRRVCFAS